jgi:type II secretory pathway pseudopilin PulG
MKTAPVYSHCRAFTLFELILALAILMLISGGVFSLTGAAMETAKTAREEQTASRRLEAFLRVTRETFLNLDAKGSVFLQLSRSGSAPGLELVFKDTSGAFGSGSLGKSSLVLAALPEAGGTRAFAMRRVPAEGTSTARETPWIPLMSGVERVRWTFFSAGDWSEEWPAGRGRPELVRLNFTWRDFPEPIEAVFWLPPMAAPPQPSPSPAP